LVTNSSSSTNIQTKTVALTYNQLGQVTTLQRSAGGPLVAQTNYAYDPLNRLAGLQHQHGTTTTTYTYTYDAANRIKTLTEGTGTTTYTYDKTNQLTGADRPNTLPDEAYSYDANGNRTNAGYATRADNRLRSDGTYTYRYDNEGNLISQIGAGLIREFTWDYRNRLTKVVDKNSSNITTKSVEYTYDALNQRIAKSVDPDGAGGQVPTVTRFVYDRDHVALEFTGSTTTRYLYGTEIDQILAMEKASQTTWLLTDHLGSVRQGVNNAGTVTGSLEYNSFGQVVSQTGAVSDWRYRYTGREFDGETGLYYYRARYYDAGVGRFIGQDPLGFAAGDNNFYRYVGNNVVHLTDPSGEKAEPYSGVTIGDYTRFLTYQTQSGGTGYALNTSGLKAAKPKGIVKDRFAAKFRHQEGKANVLYANPADILGNRTGSNRGDDRGHILPFLIGANGLATNKANLDNFFWQNSKINKGAYNQFGKEIKNMLVQRHQSGDCYPKFYMKYEVDFYYKDSKNPLRPSSFEVTVTGIWVTTRNTPIIGGLFAVESSRILRTQRFQNPHSK
jgi:RHS repeat-associated protein